MGAIETGLIFNIVIATLVLVAMSAFIIFMIFLHQNRTLKHKQKLMEINAIYQESLIEAEAITREQVLNHIGAELHDNIAQILAITKMHLTSSKPNIKESTSLLAKAINETRQLSHELNKQSGNNQSLLELMEPTIKALKAAGIEVIIELDDTHHKYAKQQKMIIFRVIQETIHNVLKHAEASRIWISTPNNNSIIIEDNGIGFDVNKRGQGQGIQNLTKRMTLIGGEYKIESSLKKGTRVSIIF